MNHQPGQEVVCELARVHWLVEYLGAQPMQYARLLQDLTGSQGRYNWYRLLV